MIVISLSELVVASYFVLITPTEMIDADAVAVVSCIIIFYMNQQIAGLVSENFKEIHKGDLNSVLEAYNLT